jgi:hypothetical protein
MIEGMQRGEANVDVKFQRIWFGIAFTRQGQLHLVHQWCYQIGQILGSATINCLLLGKLSLQLPKFLFEATLDIDLAIHPNTVGFGTL